MLATIAWQIGAGGDSFLAGGGFIGSAVATSTANVSPSVVADRLWQPLADRPEVAVQAAAVIAAAMCVPLVLRARAGGPRVLAACAWLAGLGGVLIGASVDRAAAVGAIVPGRDRRDRLGHPSVGGSAPSRPGRDVRYAPRSDRMSLLRDIEQKIEGLFERGFRKAFRSSLQPVELARKLAREMEDHKTISVSRVYVPNDFTVYLSSRDRESFASYERSLVTELGSYLDAHARGAGLSLVAPATVTLATDEDLRVGEFGIACRLVDPPAGAAAEAPAPAAPAESPEGDGPAAAVPPVVAPPVAPPPPVRPYQALEGVSGTQVISAADARDAGLTPETMTLVIGTTRTRLTKRVSTLGRSRDCEVVVADPNASRIHAEVRHIGLDYFLVDMGSTNGTEVNGQLVKRHALAHGDTIVIGTTQIHVELR